MFNIKKHLIFLVLTVGAMPAVNSAQLSKSILRASPKSKTMVGLGLGAGLVVGSLFLYKHYQKKSKCAQQDQVKIMRPFFDDKDIAVIRKVMDDIEQRKLGYDDYAKRTGLIWSDVAVKTTGSIELVEEFNTAKATLVDGMLKQQNPQSVFNYPAIQSIICNQVFPKMLAAIEPWEKEKLPEKVFAQIFLQRCKTSEPMDWHQDPGEDYDPQANYSLVIMLAEQSDPEHGWEGGLFKIRSGFPGDAHTESDVTKIMHRCNQGILFNNQTHSHAVTAVTTKTGKTKRDLLVITLNLNKMPTKKS